nr:hypothetical protein [Tanacetum cinerariifolium]
MPQAYPQYGTAPTPMVNDGYINPGPSPGGYGQQDGQLVSEYVQTGKHLVMLRLDLLSVMTSTLLAYGAPPVQLAYSQPTLAQAPAQTGYDQSISQTGGYVSQPQPQAQPQPQPQPGYGQYDNSKMCAAQRLSTLSSIWMLAGLTGSLVVIPGFTIALQYCSVN